MERSTDGRSTPGPARPAPIFDLRDVTLPGSPILCFLYPEPDGETVRAYVNTAHELRGYEHATYHTHHEPVNGPRVCVDGVPCGYEPSMQRGPS